MTDLYTTSFALSIMSLNGRLHSNFGISNCIDLRQYLKYQARRTLPSSASLQATSISKCRSEGSHHTKSCTTSALLTTLRSLAFPNCLTLGSSEWTTLFRASSMTCGFSKQWTQSSQKSSLELLPFLKTSSARIFINFGAIFQNGYGVQRDYLIGKDY